MSLNRLKVVTARILTGMAPITALFQKGFQMSEMQ